MPHQTALRIFHRVILSFTANPRQGAQRAGSATTGFRPSSVALHRLSRSLSRDSRVIVVALLGLVAQLHQVPRSLLDGRAPIDGNHAPSEVGFAAVGAGALTVERRTIQAALVVRPGARLTARWANRDHRGGEFFLVGLGRSEWSSSRNDLRPSAGNHGS